MVIFNRIPGGCGCDATVEKPPYDDWFASRGVTEADFNEMMDAVVEPPNTYASHIVCYLLVTIISQGLCGWCCMMVEGMSIPGKIQATLDKFNAKYPSIKGTMSQAPPGLCFTGPRLEQPGVPNAVVVAVPENPMEKLEKLKAMMDKGLITEADYEAKKATILSGM